MNKQYASKTNFIPKLTWKEVPQVQLWSGTNKIVLDSFRIMSAKPKIERFQERKPFIIKKVQMPFNTPYRKVGPVTSSVTRTVYPMEFANFKSAYEFQTVGQKNNTKSEYKVPEISSFNNIIVDKNIESPKSSPKNYKGPSLNLYEQFSAFDGLDNLPDPITIKNPMNWHENNEEINFKEAEIPEAPSGEKINKKNIRIIKSVLCLIILE